MTFKAQSVNWIQAKQQLISLREKVYVYEWRIPHQQEFDERDQDAFHVLLQNEQGDTIATGRLTPQGELGRIAVIAPFRRQEVYQALFTELITIAQQQKIEAISVQCELQGVEKYQQQGFYPVGTVFMDAGIPRQKMCRATNEFSLNGVELIH